MAVTSAENRPFKFGPNDRREFIVYNSEVEIRCENDSDGNPIYIAFAKAGSAEGDNVWQIRECTWDANGSLTHQKWPQDASGIPTTNYAYSYTGRAGYTYS